MRHKFLGHTFLILAFAGIYLSIGFLNSSESSYFLSKSSQNHLEELNNQYGMIVVPLTYDSSEAENISSQILGATVLRAELNSNAEANQGLIVLTGDASDSEILLLQPLQEFSELQLAELAKKYEDEIPEFIHIEPDQSIVLSESIQRSGSFKKTDTSPVQIVSENDFIPTVALIDTGIDKNHEEFLGNENLEILAGWDLIGNDQIPDDEVGHGTHIAGIISQGAPLKIFPIKIVGSTGGQLSHLIQALHLAIEADVDIINLSLGVYKDSPALNRMIDEAEAQGIVVIAASGNDDQNTCFYPACYDSVIAVGAVLENGEKSQKSNFGPWVDVAGPGYPILSSTPGNLYTYKKGTSQAAAEVTSQVLQLFHEDESVSSEDLSSFFDEFEKVPSGPLEGIPLIP